MTKEEREWYANPYLRMLVSPMRRDLMSGRVLPRDFLLRFTILNIPGSRASTFSSLMVAPDLIEHRRYKSQAGRVGHYIECNKAVIEMSEQRQYWRKIPSKNAQFNIPYFQARTGHLLRLRVLQELELLAQHLQPRPRAAGESPVMRRLTRAEFNNIKETGVIPFEKAIAVIVVPPVNMNPKTKQRPIPADSSLPPQEDDRPIPEKPLPPLCTLLPTVKDDPLVDVPTTPQYLPPAKVPLYHGLAAFPSRAQRAALHKALNRILSIERTARWREHGRPEGTVEGEEGRKQEDPWARGDKKGSHAYIIFSSADTVLRADTVPLAIALWRLRLWEGDGWDNKSKNTSAGGWKIILPKRLPS
ncbi:hypothetical protein PsYK624_005680 [Phanerochaete sordida]|uniref:Uncharacterized protein n=1 Tax=Phanerochaete sordida TaxID=48140 RepID=A0A9P3L8A7_9APHY|nr:hypothetical protein PsYK624_005680 [Phanerochaete sordida]